MDQPPAGYDAVIGEPGGDLNYDEAIGRCFSCCPCTPLTTLITPHGM